MDIHVGKSVILTVIIDDISQNKGVNLTYKDYTSVTGTVDALLSGEVESVMLNEAYMSMLDDMEGYQDVSSKVRAVYSTDIEYSVKGDVNEDYLSNDEHLVQSAEVMLIFL